MEGYGEALEGVLAKRKDSIYEPGKCTGAWVQLCVRNRRQPPRARADRMQRLAGDVIN